MEAYKSLGIISVVWLWVGLIFMIKKWPGKVSMSYSAHAAATPQGIAYYLIVFGTHLVLFYIFATKWFAPTFHMPVVFNNLLLIGVIGEFIALLIPTVGGIWTKVHNATSYVMLVALIPLTLMIFSSTNIAELPKLLALLSVSYMIFACVLFIFFSETAKKYFLIHQTIYGISFHLAVLAATYID